MVKTDLAEHIKSSTVQSTRELCDFTVMHIIQHVYDPFSSKIYTVSLIESNSNDLRLF